MTGLSAQLKFKLLPGGQDQNNVVWHGLDTFDCRECNLSSRITTLRFLPDLMSPRFWH